MAIYETQEEAHLRLGGTVVMYDGEPILCTEVHGPNNGLMIQARKLPRGQEHIDIALEDPKLNLRNINLGYMNTEQGATFVMRMPVRKYKQGLSRENLVFPPINPGAKQAGGGFDNVIFKPEFRDMLCGKYPSVAEAAKRIRAEGGPKSVAFHRRMALAHDEFRKDFLLKYRGRKIAYGDAQIFVLPDEYRYMREAILESGLRVQ